MTLGVSGLGEQLASPYPMLTPGAKGEAAEAQLHGGAPKGKSPEKIS